jgi:hypothetical protein
MPPTLERKTLMSLPALALAVLSLVPAQAGNLELSNIRATYGALGPNRPDLKILPGDILQVAFDINGLTADNAGRLQFAARMTVTKPATDAGKEEVIYEEEPREMPPVVNVLGGGKVPHAVAVTTGLNQSPGLYRLNVTITDLQSRKTGSFTRDFTIEKLDFGLVRLQLSYDRFGQLAAPAAAAVGQTLYLNAVVIGYKPDPKNQQATLQFELNVLDEAGKPALAKPLTGEVKNIPVDTHVPFRFELPIHRTGRYKLVVKATDEIAKKTTSVTVPLLAVEQK